MAGYLGVESEKRVFFMRHGRALLNTDYEHMDYNEFMKFMLKKTNPKLYKEQNEITIPVEIDVIYPSPSCRAIESAELISGNLVKTPQIDCSLGKLIDEVDFSTSILSESEFNERGGFNNACRDLILERWFKGENVETFQDSENRLNELRLELAKSKFKNILIITHAWYLRLVYLVYAKKEKTLRNLLTAPITNYGEVLRESVLYPNRFFLCMDRDISAARSSKNNGHAKISAHSVLPEASGVQSIEFEKQSYIENVAYN